MRHSYYTTCFQPKPCDTHVLEPQISMDELSPLPHVSAAYVYTSPRSRSVSRRTTTHKGSVSDFKAPEGCCNGHSRDEFYRASHLSKSKATSCHSIVSAANGLIYYTIIRAPHTSIRMRAHDRRHRYLWTNYLLSHMSLLRTYVHRHDSDSSVSRRTTTHKGSVSDFKAPEGCCNGHSRDEFYRASHLSKSKATSCHSIVSAANGLIYYTIIRAPTRPYLCVRMHDRRHVMTSKVVNSNHDLSGPGSRIVPTTMHTATARV